MSYLGNVIEGNAQLNCEKYPNGFGLEVTGLSPDVSFTHAGIREALLHEAHRFGVLAIPRETLSGDQRSQLSSGDWIWRRPPFTANAKTPHSDGPKGLGLQVFNCEISPVGRSTGFAPLVVATSSLLSLYQEFLDDVINDGKYQHLPALRSIRSDLKSSHEHIQREALMHLRHKLCKPDLAACGDRYLDALQDFFEGLHESVIEFFWKPCFVMVSDQCAHWQWRFGNADSDKNAILTESIVP